MQSALIGINERMKSEEKKLSPAQISELLNYFVIKIICLLFFYYQMFSLFGEDGTVIIQIHFHMIFSPSVLCCKTKRKKYRKIGHGV